jgi:hypothetical protein
MDAVRERRSVRSSVRKKDDRREVGNKLAFPEIDGKLHVAIGGICHRFEGGPVLAAILEEFGHQGDITGHAFRQALGHGLPVLLEKGPGDQPLHDRDGHDENQKGPAKQAFRQISFQRSQISAVLILENRISDQLVSLTANGL